MANSESTSPAPAPAPAVKMPILPLLLCVVAAVLLAVGGCAAAMFMLVKSGRLGLPGVAAGTAAAAPAKPAPEVPTQSLVLDSLLANLADGDGHGYLRIGLVLQVEESTKKDKEKDKEKDPKAPNPVLAGFRDSVLEVLGREQSTALLAPDGKERLKHELLAKFAQSNPESKVREIYFTDFLVQR